MNRPLQNRKIVLTRSKDQSSENIKQLTDLGAEVISLPTIKVIFENVDTSQIGSLNQYDYIIFTSSNAVESFTYFIQSNKINFSFNSVKIAVTGSKTKERCIELGIKVDLLPDDFSASGVISTLSAHDLDKKKILIPASKIARDELRIGLTKLGAIVKQIPFYNVVKTKHAEVIDKLEKLKKEKIDLYIFTSPSTFENFIELAEIENVKEFFAGSIIAAIGPTTARALTNTGLKVDLVPEQYTMDSLVKLLTEHFNNSEIAKN